MAGSVGGDYAGMAVGDQLMRGKDMLSGGKGQTPYERMSVEEQEKYALHSVIKSLPNMASLPGTREQYAMDPTTGMGVN